MKTNLNMVTRKRCDMKAEVVSCSCPELANHGNLNIKWPKTVSLYERAFN